MPLKIAQLSIGMSLVALAFAGPWNHQKWRDRRLRNCLCRAPRQV